MASIHETLGAGRKDRAKLIAADPPRRGVFRRIVLPTLLAAVFVGFAAIVWLAWRDAYPGGGEPPLIRAAPGPIKRPPDTPGGVDFEGERHGIASVLNGPPPAPRVERLLPREPAPPRTLAEADPALVAPPPARPPEPPATAASPAPSPPAVVTAAAPTGSALPGSGAAAADGTIRPTAPSVPAATAPDRASVALAPPPAATPALGPEPLRPMPLPSGSGEPARAGEAPTSRTQSAEPTTTAAARASTGPAEGPAAPAARLERPDPASPVRPSPVTSAAPPAPPSATARPAAPAPSPAPERLAAREAAGREPGAPSPPAPDGGGPWGVQIAAVSSREAAERGWSRLQSRHPDVLGSLRLRVDEAKLASGLTLYRLQGVGFPDRESAARACARLKAAGTECFVVGGR